MCRDLVGSQRVWFIDDQTQKPPSAGQVTDRRPFLVGQPMRDELAQSTISLSSEHPERDIVRVGQLGSGLDNVLQRAALLAGTAPISAGTLNLPAVLPARSDEPVLDRATIERVLTESDHIVAQAARQLGISRQALYRRMEKLGIKESPGR